MNEENKKGIVLNRMYTGSYLSTNLGHEVINMFQADNGNHYLYLNATGDFSADYANKIGSMLLIKYAGQDEDGRPWAEVLGCATGLRDVYKRGEDGKTITQNEEYLVEVDEKQEIKDRIKDIKYGGVAINKVFEGADQQDVLISYQAANVKVPKQGKRIFLRFKAYGDSKQPVFFGTSDNIEVAPIVYEKEIDFYGSYLWKAKNEQGKEAYILSDSKVYVVNMDVKFASTSLKNYIEKDEKLTCLINDSDIWDDNSIEKLSNCTNVTKPEISIFNICQIENSENSISNALAFFMDKYRAQCCNFFKEYDIILNEKFKISREVDSKIEVKNKAAENYKSSKGRIDLLIEDDNNIIIIENKIKSDINGVKGDCDGKQLKRYHTYANWKKNEYGIEVIKQYLKEKLIHGAKCTVTLINENEILIEKPKGNDKILKFRNKTDEKVYENVEVYLDTLKEEFNKFDKKNVYLFILSPNYNKPHIEEYEKEGIGNEEWKQLTYRDIYEYLKDFNIEGDKNLTDFYNVIVRHTKDNLCDWLKENMRNTFIYRISELKDKTMPKYFTKSAFKVALECPRQLYYYNNEKYENQNNDDSFLQSLAEGGFQVGELAKIYCDVNEDIKSLDYNTSLEKTKELLKEDSVNIAEAAFCYNNCFVRVDILKKNGNNIELIEVKAKSWTSDDSFTSKSKKSDENKIASAIREYVYDVAFQKWVVVNALKELYPGQRFNVKAYLMMADKGKIASIDGMNQYFRIVKENGRTKIERSSDAVKLKEHEQVLTAFDVNELCDAIIKGETGEQEKLMGMKFESFVETMSDCYCNNKKAVTSLGTKCFKCPFDTSKGSELLSGYKECWKDMAKFKDEDFEKPLVKDLWGSYVNRDEFIKNGSYFLEGLKESNFKNTKITDGLNHVERKLLQVGLATNNEKMLEPFLSCINDGIYIDVDGLRDEMSKWKFPLHMIDFETTAVALPFYKGLRPYEQVAFQFSHHVIEKANGSYVVKHIGQYLNTQKGFFPNFGFARELKRQLEKDEGSVFRYSHHENSILRSIYEQLDKSNEKDKDELMCFIDSITHYKNDKKEVRGERDMIDLCEIVKKYFYHPSMKGSNSIKVVLPAVLNSSKLLKYKYSKPIYGKDIISQNYNAGNAKVWISYDENGVVENPYKHLEPVSAFLDLSEEEIRQYEDSLEESVSNGGAALAAYSKLQFSDDVESAALQEALLRYCELDTLAMVFIWEYFNEMIS